MRRCNLGDKVRIIPEFILRKYYNNEIIEKYITRLPVELFDEEFMIVKIQKHNGLLDIMDNSGRVLFIYNTFTCDVNDYENILFRCSEKIRIEMID